MKIKKVDRLIDMLHCAGFTDAAFWPEFDGEQARIIVTPKIVIRLCPYGAFVRAMLPSGAFTDYWHHFEKSPIDGIIQDVAAASWRVSDPHPAGCGMYTREDLIAMGMI